MIVLVLLRALTPHSQPNIIVLTRHIIDDLPQVGICRVSELHNSIALYSQVWT